MVNLCFLVLGEGEKARILPLKEADLRCVRIAFFSQDGNLDLEFSSSASRILRNHK